MEKISVDSVFQLCVELLKYLGNALGYSYVEINIIVFIIIGPIVLSTLMLITYLQYKKIKNLKLMINK